MDCQEPHNTNLFSTYIQHYRGQQLAMEMGFQGRVHITCQDREGHVINEGGEEFYEVKVIVTKNLK